MTNFIGPTQVDLKLRRPTTHVKLRHNDFPRDILPILAIDPGGTTGWSLLVLRKRWCEREIFSWPFDTIVQHRLRWTHGEIDCHEEDLAAYHICRMIDGWPTAVIVVEDFILRPERREKSRELLSPVRMISKIEYHCWRSGRSILRQQPSMAKSTATDSRLKIWGCYTAQGGLVHARDADRHALTFLRRCFGTQGVPLRRLAWPFVYNQVDAEAEPVKVPRGFKMEGLK